VRRHLFNLAAALSLMLFAVTVVSWARSHRVLDTVEWAGRRGQLRDLATMPGQLRFATAPRFGGPWNHYTGVETDQRVSWSRRWLRHERAPWGVQVSGYTEELIDTSSFPGARPLDVTLKSGRTIPLDVTVIIVRYALFAVVFALLPLFVTARALWRWRHLRAPEACPTCGYDLRATPERCPECGAVPNVS
jgi:hypothetical protein